MMYWIRLKMHGLTEKISPLIQRLSKKTYGSNMMPTKALKKNISKVLKSQSLLPGGALLQNVITYTN